MDLPQILSNFQDSFTGTLSTNLTMKLKYLPIVQSLHWWITSMYNKEDHNNQYLLYFSLTCTLPVFKYVKNTFAWFCSDLHKISTLFPLNVPTTDSDMLDYTNTHTTTTATTTTDSDMLDYTNTHTTTTATTTTVSDMLDYTNTHTTTTATTTIDTDETSSTVCRCQILLPAYTVFHHDPQLWPLTPNLKHLSLNHKVPLL